MNPWARPLPVPGVLSMDRASENYAWWPAFPKTFLSLEVLLPLSDFPRPGKKTSNPEHWHFLGPPHIRIWRHALPQTLELVLIVYFDKNILMSDYHSTHATKQIDNRYLCEPNKTWVGPRLQSWFCLLSITKYMVVSVLPKLGFFFVYNPSSTTLNLKHEQPHWLHPDADIVNQKESFNHGEAKTKVNKEGHHFELKKGSGSLELICKVFPRARLFCAETVQFKTCLYQRLPRQ